MRVATIADQPEMFPDAVRGDRAPTTEPCQHCGAPKGESCITPNGKASRYAHAIRRLAASRKALV